MDSEQGTGGGRSGAPVNDEAALQQAMLYCPNCSAKLGERGCKLRCPRCHYYMSCSDYV